jgi:CubicO group peptidase (beta-lactamase class C family)
LGNLHPNAHLCATPYDHGFLRPYPSRAGTHHAQPYHHDPVRGEVPLPWGRLQYLQSLAPAGGIAASIDEMARYALLRPGDGTLFGLRVVSAETLAGLHRPEIAVGADWTSSAPAETMHYALGWFTANIRGLHLVFHNGANPVFRASIFLVPSFEAAVVVLTNGESDLFTDAAIHSLLEQLLR